MFAPAGFRRDELGDIEVLVHEGRLHLFHLCLPSHDRIAHLVSDDGLRWLPVQDALRVGAPGSFDDDMLWTMAVARVGDTFRMLYTALGTADGGSVQRVGVATSTDLLHWTRHEHPVAELDPELYQGEPRVSAPWVSWRDPKPFLRSGEGPRFGVTVCAQSRQGPLHRRGVVAWLTSDDLQAFSAEPALYAPFRDFELECPQLFELGGRTYLIASIQNDRSQRYFVADGPGEPLRTPPRNRLLPDGHYAARVFESAYGPAILGWLRVVDGCGQVRHVLTSPLLLTAKDDGVLGLASWPAWADLDWDPTESWAPTEAMFGNTLAEPERRGVGRVSAGQELWLDDRLRRDVRIEGILDLRAPVGGLAFGIDADGSGWFIELDRGEHRARLRRNASGRDAQGAPWFQDRVVQEAVVELPEGPTTFALRMVGGEVELALGGAVVLCTVIGDHAGRTGMWCDSGEIRVEQAQARSLDSV